MVKRRVEGKKRARGNKIMRPSARAACMKKHSYTNAAVDETSPEAGRLQVRVFLRAGHLDAPHLLPGVVQLHMDRVDARVVGRHSVAHVGGDSMLLEMENTWMGVRRREKV